MTDRLRVHLLTWGLVGVALYLVGTLVDHLPLRLLAKPLPMLALIAWTWRRAPNPTGRAVVVALALGLAGDMLLEISSATFIAGLIAFLLGHIVYGAAFTRQVRALHLGLAVPWLLLVGAVYAILGDALGGMLVPVVAYMVVICGMAWRASARAAGLGGRALLGLAGAVLFVFSDTLIALDRFGEPIDGVRPAIILTYWAAQAGLAASCWGEPGRERA